MPQFNIKLYLILSGVLAVVLIVILVIPLGKKTGQPTTTQSSSTPSPTAAEAKSQNETVQPTIALKDFTGVEEQVVPESIAVPAGEKQDLRSRVPFDTGLFKLDFDYSQDKFTVTLSEPKTDNLRQFEDWKKNEYPDIPMDQFIFN